MILLLSYKASLCRDATWQSQHLTDRSFPRCDGYVKVGSGMDAVTAISKYFIVLLVVLFSAPYQNDAFPTFSVAIAIRAEQVGIAKGQIQAKGSPERQ